MSHSVSASAATVTDAVSIDSSPPGGPSSPDEGGRGAAGDGSASTRRTLALAPPGGPVAVEQQQQRVAADRIRRLVVAERADAALVAYPHKTAALAVKQLRERGLKGVDLSVRATFNRHWSGFANFGWLKSVWTQYFSSVTPSGKPINLGGVPVSNSPKDTLTAGVSYRFFLPAASFKATLWDQYVGTRYLWDNNAGQPTSQTMPAYDLVNFSLTANTKWLSSHIDGVRGSSVSLQVLNLTNKEYNSTEYISSGGYFQTTNSGYIIANPGTPRAVYLSVSLKF